MSVCFDYDVTIKPFQHQNNVLESVSDDIDFKAILSPQEAFDPRFRSLTHEGVITHLIEGVNRVIEEVLDSERYNQRKDHL